MAFQPALFRYLFDTSSLINIERNRKMKLIQKHKGSVLIPQRVADEVNQPNTPLRRFITRNPAVILQFEHNEEEQYLRIRSQVGIHDAEASAIAISIRRKLSLVMDDKKGREKAENHGIKTFTWVEFLKELSKISS